MPLLTVDEYNLFLVNFIWGKKNSFQVKKLCRLYDGCWWSATKGSKAKRVKLDNARISGLLFKTPKKFEAEVRNKMSCFKDGLT